MRIAVIGAGKMGLPLACQLASRGGEVVACDINESLVASINAGQMPFEEPGVGELLAEAVKTGALSASSDLVGTLPKVDTVIVIIPVLLTKDNKADITSIENVTRTIAASLVPGQMISYETTLPVGTTRNRLQPILESSGQRAGIDFDLVFSPERVKSRLVLKHLTTIPKIVGGVNPASAKRAADFYHTYLGAPVINVGSLEASEFAKLAGMVYRDVNIALANELAEYAEAAGLDFGAVTAASNADHEVSLLSPGIGVGGHCTPVYPYFVLQDAEQRGLPLPITSQARKINDGQAARLLDRVTQRGISLAEHDLLILGLGFRPNVKEHTLSSAFQIREEGKRRGANVFLHDPLYSHDEIRTHGFASFDLDQPTLPAVVVLNTGHAEYAQIDLARWHERGVRLIVDGRNFWNEARIREAGIKYVAPGIH